MPKRLPLPEVKVYTPSILECVEKYICEQPQPKEPKVFSDWGKVATAYPTSSVPTYVGFVIFGLIALAIWWF